MNEPKNSFPKVEISKEQWDYLKERDRILTALEAAGVDNWEGYSEAFQDDDEDETE